MKKLQQLCLAGVFIVAFTTIAFAGDIATPGRAEPPPPPSSATASGEIPTAVQDDASYENQLIEEISTTLLRTLLSAF
jgi:hypothetical protein